MDYKLDIKLNKELRDAYNHSHFASMQEAEFNKPSSKKRTMYETNASNCICACLDRIDWHTCLDLMPRKHFIFILNQQI